jgi:hypothetical protein
MQTGFAGITTLPDAFASKRGATIVAEEFPTAGVDPVRVVIRGGTDEPVRAGLERLRGSLPADGVLGTPGEPAVAPDGRVIAVSVPIRGDVNSAEAYDAVRDLRSELVPAAFAGTDAEVLVTGETAEGVDYFALLDRWLPIVFTFVLGLSFVLLTLAFRSVVVPAVAIVLNLLSVGAAYGLLVLVFQEGVGADLLGFRQVDAIEAWVPLFLFSVLFGLSMDYQVFLLSRIREHYRRTGSNDAAVAFGISSTARLITGAALIIIAVFAGFAAGELVMFQQMGFGVAVALLVDATLIRSVLVPAAMTLLGERNWYLPRASGGCRTSRSRGPSHSAPTTCRSRPDDRSGGSATARAGQEAGDDGDHLRRRDGQDQPAPAERVGGQPGGGGPDGRGGDLQPRRGGEDLRQHGGRGVRAADQIRGGQQRGVEAAGDREQHQHDDEGVGRGSGPEGDRHAGQAGVERERGAARRDRTQGQDGGADDGACGEGRQERPAFGGRPPGLRGQERRADRQGTESSERDGRGQGGGAQRRDPHQRHEPRDERGPPDRPR